MKHFANTRTVLTYLKRNVSGKTLDFGAGNAKYRDLIQSHTSEYVTFDMIAGDNIDVVGDALNPPFPDATFDTVICTQMLEHVEKPWVVVQQIKRILKPGGVCIMTAPFLAPYHADPYDFFRYTKEGLVSFFKNEGFEIIEADTYGQTATVLAEMAHFAHFSHYNKRSELSNKWRGRIMRRVKRITAILDKTFKNPAIYANVYIVAKKVWS